MNRSVRVVFAAVFVFAILLRAATCAGSSMPEVTINIYNDAHVPERILTQAQHEASRIFHDAGVDSIWIQCRQSERDLQSTSACGAPATATHFFSLRIVPWTSRLGDSIFGSAFPGDTGLGSCGDVFYPAVERLHSDWDTSLPRVLGHVMAHEIGHLLLGTNSHSTYGIMRPHWQGEELRRIAMGTLLFTPQQVQNFRARLLKRSAESSPTSANPSP